MKISIHPHPPSAHSHHLTPHLPKTKQNPKNEVWNEELGGEG